MNEQDKKKIADDIRFFALQWAQDNGYWTSEDEESTKEENWLKIEIEYLRKKKFFCTFSIIISPLTADYGVNVKFIAEKQKSNGKDKPTTLYLSDCFCFQQGGVRTLFESGTGGSTWLLWESIRKDATVILTTLKQVQKHYDKDLRKCGNQKKKDS